jgi:peptidoglycan/xylan/chitin deacetylase (PgdA/CDA1 family)
VIFDYRECWPTKTGLYDGTDSSQITLTFDDGPYELYTQQILDMLQEQGIHATFFMVGKYVQERREIARAVHKAGHTIGNHTYNHLRLGSCTREQVKAEIEKCQKTIQDVIGITPTVFRPPIGQAPVMVEQVATDAGLRIVIWSVTACDWELGLPTLIVNQVREEIDSRNKGEIVLLHDGDGDAPIGADRKPTVDAVRSLINHYTSAGRHFVPLSKFSSVSQPRSTL